MMLKYLCVQLDRINCCILVKAMIDIDVFMEWHLTGTQYVFVGNLESSAVVKVTLTDVNDNHPEFYPLNYSINVDLSEANTGTTIVRVQAQDPDSSNFGSIQYSITAGNDRGYFSIITNSGELDVEKKPTKTIPNTITQVNDNLLNVKYYMPCNLWFTLQ